ncbi:MAG TPA: DUF1254 domain-containing protein [Burkholderiaceae bacterium]|nr:DUF1254 domain-containing protein [Burkholderiaceae bacterium]
MSSSGSHPTPQDAIERVRFGRAVEAIVWGMPVVNYDLMYQEMVRKVKGDFNQILYWSRLLDWKNQTLTPNPDVIYLMPFFDTKDGPVVLEVPPADDGLFNGSIMNRWQAAIEDIGPGGLDKGKGGKYLVLPPGYDPSKVPAGYIPMPSDSRLGYALIRSVLKSGSDADVAKAVAYAKRMKLYPLSKAADPPATRYIDASEVIFDSTIQYDLRFFESLDRMVQAEPWLERDKAMIDSLKTIGIERGKPFKPDARSGRILEEALQVAKVYLETIYESLPPYYEGGRWFFPVSEEMTQNVKSFWRKPDSYPTDNRGLAYSIAFFSGMHVGEAQYYLMSIADRKGQAFDGKALYRVTVPAKAPVTQYWSMTVYDRATHAFIRNAKWVGRSSQTPSLQWNPDGSAEIYFGAEAPKGKESNWIPTDPNGRFEVLARFYGPQTPLFDKTWRLSDIEKL